MLGNGMANTVQVIVAEKVTFSVSLFDGVTVTFGGSAGNIQTSTVIHEHYKCLRVTKIDEIVDWTMNVFPGAPVLLATQW